MANPDTRISLMFWKYWNLWTLSKIIPGETAKGKTQSKEKGLWPWPLRISLPCSYQVQILNLVSDWLRPWTSDLISSLYQTGLTSHSQNQWEARFKIWTWYEHGSEILNGRGQRPLSTLWSFHIRASGSRVLKFWLGNQKLATWLKWPNCVHIWSQKMVSAFYRDSVITWPLGEDHQFFFFSFSTNKVFFDTTLP